MCSSDLGTTIAFVIGCIQHHLLFLDYIETVRRRKKKLTLAEVPQARKNAVSHRGNALRALRDSLASDR